MELDSDADIALLNPTGFFLFTGVSRLVSGVTFRHVRSRHRAGGVFSLGSLAGRENFRI